MTEPHRGGRSSDLLAGITVVEIGDDVGVRYCGRLFAALGARVLHAPQARNDAGLGFGEAYGAWLDERKAAVDPAEQSGAACALVIGGQDRTEITRAERFAAAHPDRPAVLALAWFDSAGPYGDWIGSDEAADGLEPVVPQRAPPPVVSPGPARGKHKGAAKGSTAN